ncbi:signal peptidase I, partial [Gillisia sp. Q332]
MFSAFVHRRPWFAGLVGLLLGPFIGMLYLGKGRKAIQYLALGLSVYGLPPVLAHLGLLPVKAETVILVLLIAYRLWGALDCHRIARLCDGAVPMAWFARWYVVAALGIVLPLAVRGLVWEPYNLPSASMEPSLRLGDYFIVTKLPYILDQPQRGDLVVFISSPDETPYVKRLAGLPGDRVQMQAGSLYLNGERLLREEVDMFQENFDPGRGEVYAEFLP